MDEAERLRGLLGGLPLVVWEADARTGAFTFVSEHAETLLGYPVTRWTGDEGFWASITHPDDRVAAVEFRARNVAERDDFESDYRVTAADGRVLWVHDVVHVVRGAGGEPRTLRGLMVDVTARRFDEDRERFLAELELALQPLTDAEQIMAEAARGLGEHLGADRCAYARAEADEDHFLMSGDHATGLPHLPGRYAMADFGEGCLRAMRAGEPWVVTDSGTDPAVRDLDAYRLTGIRAVICVPLLKAGRFTAAMAVHQASPRVWTDDDVELVGDVAARCWESLERAHAARELRESERRHRMLFEHAADAVWMADHDLRFVEVNPAACALLGHTREHLLSVSVPDLLLPDSRDRLADLAARLATGDQVTEVWEVRHASGTPISVELSIAGTPAGLQAIGRDVTARRAAEAEREAELRREHEIAQALQHSLLPRELPDLTRLATAARYRSGSRHAQTGGDWYEVLPTSRTSVAMVVGDVVGKGPRAAAVMGQLRSALAAYLLDGHSPASALQRLDLFATRNPGAVGSTCACLLLDWDTGVLRWSAAGHPPPLVVDETGARFLTGTTGTLLGADGTFTENEVCLSPGTSLVLYTDGLVERRHHLIDDDLARLADLVAPLHALDPETITDHITTTLLDDGHDDDVALVVARYLPAPLSRRDVPATPAVLAEVRTDLSRWGALAALPQDTVIDLNLILGEAAANSVEHAYPHGGGTLDYSVTRGAGGSLRTQVRDRGRWRPPPADPGHRGRGLAMIRSLAATTIQHGPEGTLVDARLPTNTETTPTTTPPPRVERTPTTPDHRVRVSGDLDLTGAAHWRPELLAHAAHGEPLTVDLTEVSYLSSSGMALLLDMAARTTVTVRVTEGSGPARVLGLSALPAHTVAVEVVTT